MGIQIPHVLCLKKKKVWEYRSHDGVSGSLSKQLFFLIITLNLENLWEKSCNLFCKKNADVMFLYIQIRTFCCQFRGAEISLVGSSAVGFSFVFPFVSWSCYILVCMFWYRSWLLNFCFPPTSLISCILGPPSTVPDTFTHPSIFDSGPVNDWHESKKTSYLCPSSRYLRVIQVCSLSSW